MAGWSTMAYGPLAEAAVRVGSPDAEVTLNEADAAALEYELYAIQAQLQRARGMLMWQRGDLHAAVSVLQSSANTARSQESVLELGRTLAVLAEVARAGGEARLAASADNERASIVERTGPEVRGLVWAGASVTPAACF